MNCPTRDPEPNGNPTFNQNPPAYEKTLIPRSSPQCGGGLREDEYNLGLHIMALFVVLAQSTLACAFPLIAKRFPRLRIPPSFLFFARHFGTGVLVATAFVHLLPTAFISLTDACLPTFWHETYPAMAGAIAMCAVFFVALVEMVFTRGLCKGQYSESDHKDAALEHGSKEKPARTGAANSAIADGSESEDDADDNIRIETVRRSTPDSERIGGSGGVGRLGFGIAGQRRSRSHSISAGLQHFSSPPTAAPVTNNKLYLSEKQIFQKATLQVLLLEMGILFHSVFIGMALSVTVGPAFIVLLIAVIFHQTFEGLALGSRIATISWKAKSWQPWVMACAYGLTTPLGQAIGLGTHTLYQPESPTGLLMVGIMNAISSGLLVFAGLVELLAEDFLSDESWATLKGRKRIWAFFWVIAGAVCMSIVGAFA